MLVEQWFQIAGRHAQLPCKLLSDQIAGWYNAIRSQLGKLLTSPWTSDAGGVGISAVIEWAIKTLLVSKFNV